MSSDSQVSGNNVSVLIVGFGNPLLGDDGLGVVAVEELERRYHLPTQVNVLDGGTSSIGLYEKLANESTVCIVDAVLCDEPPGTLVRLCGDQIPTQMGKPLSPHQIDLSNTLALMTAAGDLPRQLCVLGMVPESLAPGEGLSNVVASNMDVLVEMIVRELRDAGVMLRSST